MVLGPSCPSVRHLPCQEPCHLWASTLVSWGFFLRCRKGQQGRRHRLPEAKIWGCPADTKSWMELQKVGQQLVLEAEPLDANGLQLPSSRKAKVAGSH